MRVMVLFGTRPEIIRLSRVIKRLDSLCELTLVHTGQNYDPNLSDIFFKELDLRHPDIHLGIEESIFAIQASQIVKLAGEAMVKDNPDRLLILGDTNSGLAAIVASRMGIPVYHMEAGNRCFDNRVPEEINRRLIDHSSTVLMPYTHRSKENLLSEGIERSRIFVTGNPIYEIIENNKKRIEDSSVLNDLGVEAGKYFLVTLHRAENVDDPTRLESFFKGIELVAQSYREPVVVSLHPRTANRLADIGLKPDSEQVRLLEPMGFIDFTKLESKAHCVLSDSGTVQEECCLFKVPNVTLRDVTERAETIEVGSNILSGSNPGDILESVHVALGTGNNWVPPEEYTVPEVSTTVAKILLGYLHNPV